MTALAPVAVSAALGEPGAADPIHQPIIDAFRRENGLTAEGGAAESPPAGPSDAEIKYGSPVRRAAPAPASVFDLVFRHGAVPAAPDHGSPSPGPGGATANRAGYTRARLGAHANAEWDNVAPNASGQIGLFVTRATVEYSLDPIEVFVSSDYAVGSCPYRVTLEHEMEHANAYLRIFDAARESLRATLAALPTPTRAAPRWMAPAAAAAEQDAWAATFRATVGRHRTAARAEMDADRDRRDAPAAYAAVYARCPAAEWRETP